MELLKFSEEAVLYITNLVEKRGAIGLSVEAVKGGCSGMRFSFSLESSIPESSDCVKMESGYFFFVKSSAYLFVVGSVLDCVKTATGQKLVFHRANYKKQCGCGQSFL